MAVIVMALTSVAVMACARNGPPHAALASWEARFVPAAQCRPVVVLDAARSGDGASGRGALVVRLTAFDAPALVDHGAMGISLLARLDSSVQPVVTLETATDRPVPFVASLLPGRYQLAARAVGYEARTDTVTVRAEATDT